MATQHVADQLADPAIADDQHLAGRFGADAIGLASRGLADLGGVCLATETPA